MAVFNPLYKVEILDQNLNAIALVQNFVPLHGKGNWLEYTQQLSSIGKCRFRVMTKDPLFKQNGDILQPFQYNVRITRGTFVVWQGVIVNNPHRNKKWIEIEARSYLYLLSKILVRHDVSSSYPDDGNNYRHFTTGTMANVIQTILTEAISDSSSNSVLKQIQLGTIENPLFPNYFTDSSGNNVGGNPWDFSTPGLAVKFDYRDIFFVLQSLANYSNTDFELTPALQFNFRKLIGSVNNNIYFNYSPHGNIEDYDIVLNGTRMANSLVGVAADYSYNLLKDEVTQSDSVNLYGKQQGVAAFSDVKNINLLRSRLNEQLRLVAKPDAELKITLNYRAYPLGQYGLGDAVRIRIVNNVVNFDQQRRIVAIVVDVEGTGKETVTLTTNYPRPEQLI